MSNGLLQATRSRLKRQEAFLWLIPIFVAFCGVALSQKRTLDLIGACIAVLLLVFALNRPGGTLIVLVIFLPLETVLFSLLDKWHVPGSFLRPASSLKELLAFAILVAGLRYMRDTGGRLDRIDIAVFIYVAVCIAELIVPRLFSDYVSVPWSARLLSWRADAAYPLVFFGARHAPITEKMKERFLLVVMWMGAFLAFIALYQRVAGTSFEHFIMNTANVPNYFTNVLGLSPYVSATDLAYVTVLHPLHVSSLLLSPYDLGDYMVITIAIAAVRISRNHRSPMNYVIMAASLATIFFTDSRSDGVAAVIILALIALPTAKSPVEGRLRLIGAIAVAAIIVVPALGGSRFLGAQGGAVSNTGHIYEIDDGLGVIYYVPLGLGLGENPGVAARYTSLAGTVNGGDVSDNLVTQVGDELGLEALLPWLVMSWFIFLALKRRAATGDAFCASMGFSLLGIYISGQFHHVFLTYPVPWTLWAGVGLAISTYHPDTYPYTPESTISYPASAGVR